MPLVQQRQLANLLERNLADNTQDGHDPYISVTLQINLELTDEPRINCKRIAHQLILYEKRVIMTMKVGLPISGRRVSGHLGEKVEKADLQGKKQHFTQVLG